MEGQNGAGAALDAGHIRALLLRISETVEKNEAYFCELDSVVGDGDHGVTMTRGFRCLREALGPDMDAAQLFAAASKALSANMGGAIGPIYGALFGAFAKGCGETPAVDLALFARMFAEALATIQLIAEVKEGQKTLVDALAPAARALRESEKDGDSLGEAFGKAAAAAEQGAQATVEMMATKGRARFLREKSIGYRDAGASSMAVIIGAMAHYITEVSRT